MGKFTRQLACLWDHSLSFTYQSDVRDSRYNMLTVKVGHSSELILPFPTERTQVVAG